MRDLNVTCGDLATLTNSSHDPLSQEQGESLCSCCEGEPEPLYLEHGHFVTSSEYDSQSCMDLVLLVVHDALPAVLMCCMCWDELMANDYEGLVEELQGLEAMAWGEVGEERARAELGSDWGRVRVEDLREYYLEREAS